MLDNVIKKYTSSISRKHILMYLDIEPHVQSWAEKNKWAEVAGGQLEVM